MLDKMNHFDSAGNAVMADVSGKPTTERTATAKGSITVNRAVFDAVAQGTAKKGDVLGVARIAG
ncbi:MAG: cyclic pyranopterin monophosphate synthase MoaC, partial [Bacillota bacterium]|nr:cyclic pyranopterin monophosphate synthase MoaC [Bacillota bacterium]